MGKQEQNKEDVNKKRKKWEKKIKTKTYIRSNAIANKHFF